MIISNHELETWDSKYRLKFINSISGYKGVHLIGTESKEGNHNLAIFNSIVHISSEPARIGFIMRPLTVARDTYKNIVEKGIYTLNHVHLSILERAHYTSANFTSEESEFEQCNLTPETLNNFGAPFVAESNIKIALKFIEDIELKASGCHLIVGEVQFVEINQEYIEQDGQIDLAKAQNVCITGLNQYSTVQKHVNLPYARVQEVPAFNKKKRPDNVAFDDDSQSYNANLLPYGSNIGAPSIHATNLSTWKDQGVQQYNRVLKNKVEAFKKDYDNLLEEFKTNDLLYRASYDFEPIIGETYHLYQKDNKDETLLSMIPPHSWKRKHLGTFMLNSNKVWTAV